MPPPINDNFADAILLGGDSGSVTVDNSEATSEVGESSISLMNGKTVWYKYIPTVDGLATFDTFDTTDVYWTGMRLSRGATLAGQVELSISNRRERSSPSPGTGYAALSYYVFGGRTYYIQLDNGDAGPTGGEIVFTWELKPTTAPAPWNTPVATVDHASPVPHPDAAVSETFEGYTDGDDVNRAWADKDHEKSTRGWAETTERGAYVLGPNTDGGFHDGNDFAGPTFNGHQTFRHWAGPTPDARYFLAAPGLKVWQKFFIRHDSLEPYFQGWVKVYNYLLEDAGDFEQAGIFYYNGQFWTTFNLTGGPVDFPVENMEGLFAECITCFDIVQEGVNAGRQLRLRLWVEGAFVATWLSNLAEGDWTRIDVVAFQVNGNTDEGDAVVYLDTDDHANLSHVYVGEFEFVTGCNPYSGLEGYIDDCSVGPGPGPAPGIPLPCPIPDDAVVFDAEIDPLAPVLHTMAWATDTLVSRNRVEQRRSLRRYPAHVLEFTVDAVSSKETSRIDALLQLGAPDGYRVPFWPDRIPLTAVLPAASASISFATEGYSFVAGEQAILWASPFLWEIVDIETVNEDSIDLSAPTTNEWIVGTLLVPIKKGYIPANLNPSRLSRDGQSTTVTFVLCGWTYPAIDAPATYLDYEMFDVYPARLFDASETVENFADVLESKAGAFAVSWLSEEHPWERKFNWFCATRSDIAAVRGFAHRRQGKFKPFWVPTWASDFLLLAPSSIGATTFTVHDSGKDAIRNYVAFITVDAIYPREIVGYTDNLDGTRTLEVDVAIPVALAENTTVISYLSLARFADDEMPMDFVEMNTAEVELDWTEMVPLPVPA